MGEVEQSQQDLISKYQQILARNGINEIIQRVETLTPKLTGEHMASVCLYITLHMVGGKRMELFVKQLPTNPAHLDMIKDWNLFEKEAGFFNHLLKDMQEYYLKASGATEPLDFFPKCLYADDKEIIMENLVKGSGYYLNSKLDRQDFESAKLTVQNLARFHAVSYCMVQELGRENVYQKYLLNDLFRTSVPMLAAMFDNSINISTGILNNNNVPGGPEILNRLPAQRSKALAQVVDLFSPRSTHIFHVVNHGDCWNNNMLFLRDPETQELLHHVLVDFQVLRLGSPSMDLSYYLFTSLKTSTRKQHWKQLLEIYFEKLQTSVESMNARFPHKFDEFLQDFKSKIPIGFWMNSIFSIGMEIMGLMDMTKVECDVATHFNNAILNWLEENPDRGREQALDIVELWQEFDEMTAT